MKINTKFPKPDNIKHNPKNNFIHMFNSLLCSQRTSNLIIFYGLFSHNSSKTIFLQCIIRKYKIITRSLSFIFDNMKCIMKSSK